MNRRGIWPGLKHKTEGCPNLGRNLLQTFLHDACPFSIDVRINERGQVLVLVALALVALIGFVALAVDTGFVWGARRKMQTAADAAALAGAIASRQGQSSANITTAAQDSAGLDGFTDGANGVSVNVNSSYSGGGCSSNCVQVTIDQTQPTFFLKALGSPIDVKAAAVAGTTNSSACVYALGPSPGITINGTPTISLSCGALVNSSMICNGPASFSATSIGVGGSVTDNGGCSLTPSPTTGISQVSDPFSYLGAQPACSGSARFIPGSSGAGSYCGGIVINGNSTVTFSSGTYNLGSGGLIINGTPTVDGTGVTFISTGPITINGTATVNLSAPTTSGTYEGILFWDTSASGGTINGNNSSTFNGALYFPNGTLTYNGNSGSSGYTIIAAKQVVFNGNANLGDDYSSLSDGSPAKASSLYQ
jgi:Putative Flp pilus-assembly TadE/G-like